MELLKQILETGISNVSLPGNSVVEIVRIIYI
jgi:hypothetical protein